MPYKGAQDLTDQGLWTYKQAAEYIGVSPRTLTRWVQDRRLKQLTPEHIVTPYTKFPHYFRIEDVKKVKKSVLTE